MLDILRLEQELDTDQFAAVTAPLGNMLCIANAGSGKTRVLTYRIAYLVEKGEPEDSFLMLTFTVKAAREMMDRIKGLLGRSSIQITGGTFHSVAYKFIKKFRRILDYKKKVTVLDEKDAKDLMGLSREHYCAFHNIPVKNFTTTGDIIKMYSLCRNTGQNFNTYLKKKRGDNGTDTFDSQMWVESIMGIINEYEQRKREMSKMDFDDLLIHFDRLLDVPEVQKYVWGNYPNVFVDEYQDINVVQNSIIRKLSSGSNRLVAVGDDAQCIYGFRGSEVGFIRSFQTEFPGASIYPIRNNYRSTDKIVDLALSVINQGKTNDCKEMLPTRFSGAVPSYKSFGTEKDQAAYIVSEIKKAYEKGVPYNEMAVLVRMNRLPKPIELALTNARIPVSMDCGIAFFSREHIRTIVNFFKVLEDPQDQLAFWSLVGTTDGIGPKTARKIFSQFELSNFNLSMLEMVSVPKKATGSFITLSNALLNAKKFLSQENPSGEEGGSTPQQVLDIITSQWADAWMKKTYTDGSLKSRKEDLKTLRDALLDFDTVEDFLDNVALSGNDAGRGPEGKVRITTIHRAKGLEWDVVFLPYLNDSILPVSFDPDDMEEERRLCYVAITRGRNQVTMSYVQNILNMKNFFGDPSSFLCHRDSRCCYEDLY